MVWDPAQYLRFSDQRLQPALDLLGQIDLAAPRTIYDLGCGAGNVTQWLRRRWPEAHLVGVDLSESMLAAARRRDPGIEWQQADLGTWAAPEPADLIYSNAALQWLPDHPTLLARLAVGLAPAGCLAIQMPNNFAAPSHRAIAAAAAAGPWQTVAVPGLNHAAVLPMARYWQILTAAGLRCRLWETEYWHLLQGDDPVVEWTKGTALRPILDRLPEPWQTEFLADYRRRVREAYPPEADGTTLFPFRRMFLLAWNEEGTRSR